MVRAVFLNKCKDHCKKCNNFENKLNWAAAWGGFCSSLEHCGRSLFTVLTVTFRSILSLQGSMLRVKSVPVPLPLNWSGTPEDSSQIRSLEASLAYVDTSTQELYHHHTHLYIQHSGCPCSTWCGLLPWRHRHRGWRLGNQNVSTGPWNDKHTLIATDSLRVGKLRQLHWRHLL